VSGEAILSDENSEKSLGSGRCPDRAPPRTQLGSSQRSPKPVMWSETVGLRTRLVWDQKNRSWSWSRRFCVVLCCEIQSCHARHNNDLGGQSSFSSTSLVSLFCAWNITTVETNSGVHLLKSSIHQVHLFQSINN